jgi:hypothetical protein
MEQKFIYTISLFIRPNRHEDAGTRKELINCNSFVEACNYLHNLRVQWFKVSFKPSLYNRYDKISDYNNPVWRNFSCVMRELYDPFNSRVSYELIRTPRK